LMRISKGRVSDFHSFRNQRRLPLEFVRTGNVKNELKVY
jgi:hypothetical protein